jgi:endonuclease/exonuclease/phosphatase family metal-dependent hydrolase
MEIVFLNTLNGKLEVPISQFITKYAGRADMFCLQEAYNTGYNMQQICRRLLPGYSATFAYKKIDDDDFAQATYTRHKLRIVRTQELFGEDDQIGTGIISVIEDVSGPITICNFHGRSQPGHKQDTPERLTQTKQLLETFKTIAGRRIIGGDFNVDISTQSIQLFEDAGYINLIKKFGIRTTRNKVAWEQYPDTPQLHSDYIFVSPDVLVKNFEVLENEISDHLPMILEI